MVEKIISGGQTGVDQAGLLIATEMGIPIGGWCPKGGLDENNESILKKYPLTPIEDLSFEESIAERTKKNIRDSEGTLILVPKIPLPENIKDGTLLTIEYARVQKKPYLLIDMSNTKNAATEILLWIKTHNISVLNVAGPRESNSPGIHDKACELFRSFFPNLATF